jgi:hypothetical protein
VLVPTRLGDAALAAGMNCVGRNVSKLTKRMANSSVALRFCIGARRDIELSFGNKSLTLKVLGL